MDQRSLKSKSVCSFFLRCYSDPGGFHYPDGEYRACLSECQGLHWNDSLVCNPLGMVWAEPWAEVSSVMPHLWQGSLDTLAAQVQNFTLCFLSPSLRTGPLPAFDFLSAPCGCYQFKNKEKLKLVYELLLL